MERRSGGGIHGGSRVRQKGGESEWEGCRKERRITCVFLESCKESRKKKTTRYTSFESKNNKVQSYSKMEY